MSMYIRWATAVLKVSEKPAELIVQASAIADAIAANPDWFPSPTPPLSEVRAAIGRLSRAQVKARTLARGTAAARDVAQRRLMSVLRRVQSYVQTVATANPSMAEVVIRRAMLEVMRPGGRGPHLLGAKEGKGSGVVELTTPRVADRGAWYEWQMSTDGKTWKNLGGSPRSKRVVRGLEPRKDCFFRCKTSTKDGEGEWSHVISIFVR